MNQDQPTGEQFLCTADAAKQLGVVPARVRQLADTGELPTIRTVSGTRLFRLSDVLRLEQKRAARRGPVAA